MNIDPHYYYLLVNAACFIFPFGLSFLPIMPFYKHFKSVLVGMLTMMALFIPWDIYFTHIGIWGFNPAYITGNYIAGLPIEEWLFFICIPFACLYTYECVRYFGKNLRTAHYHRWISPIIIGVALLLAITHYDHFYTASSSFLCAALVFWHTYVKKSTSLSTFFVAWSILLIPFYLSNGVLTGLDFYQYPILNFRPHEIVDQIVWYNNDHNLGLRIWSVPADDFFYGMLMVLLALTGYEWHLGQNRIINK